MHCQKHGGCDETHSRATNVQNNRSALISPVHSNHSNFEILTTTTIAATFHAHAHGTPHRTPRFVAEGEESESWAYFATHQYVRIDRVVPEFLLRAGPAHDLFSPTKSAMMAPWRIPLPPQPLSSRRRRERIIK